MAGQNAQKDVVFDLDAASFSSNEFRIYHFKVSRPGLMAVTHSLFTRYSIVENKALRTAARKRTCSRRGAHSLVCVLQVKRCPRSRPHDWTQVRHRIRCIVLQIHSCCSGFGGPLY
jgi:hypothetical protein